MMFRPAALLLALVFIPAPVRAQSDRAPLAAITETAWLGRLSPRGGGRGHLEFHLGGIQPIQQNRSIGLEGYVATGERETIGLAGRLRLGRAERSLEIGPRVGLWKSTGEYLAPMPGLTVSYGSDRAAVLVMLNAARPRERPFSSPSRPGWSSALHVGGRLGEGPGLIGIAVGAALALLVGLSGFATGT
jgi:hypothetical protein